MAASGDLLDLARRRAMANFARTGPHAEAIKAVRNEGWFNEELYARFTLISDIGTWGGTSPLATIGHRMKHPFPFSAIVGQDDMKQAMILTAIDPSIGGVLVFGDRGTGKSTAVRGLAGLATDLSTLSKPAQSTANSSKIAPSGRVITQSSTHEIPTPVVDLPLGASEDRVTGALDIEQALTRAKRRFSRAFRPSEPRVPLH